MKHNIFYLFLMAILAGASLTSCSQEKHETNKNGQEDMFEDKRVVVVTGTSEDVYAQENLKSSKIVQTSNTSDLVLNVKAGKADIGLINYNTVLMFMKKYNDLVILNDSLYSNPIGFCFSQSNNGILRKQFNTFLDQLISSGEYEKIRKRWMDNFDTATMPKIPNSGANGVLEFQTEGEKAPFSFVRDGVLSGFDIEIAERFAATLSKKLDVKMSSFGGVIEAISLGHVDMAANCVFITPEREKKIDFSKPYYYCNACAFGLKSNSTAKGNNKGGFFTDLKDSFKQNFIDEHRYEMIGDGLLCTIEITVFAAFFGTLLGCLICFIRTRKNKLLQSIAKIYIQLFRGIPQVVLLMLLFYVIFASTNMNGITVSIIGFSFIFAAYVSEMFRTTIENISYGQVEAGLSMGFTPFQTFYYVILPLTIRRVLPIYKGEVTGLIKSTSIVGYITVQDLTKISDMIRSATFDAFMPLILITIIYFFIIWLFSLLLKAVEIKYVPKVSRFK